MDRREVVEIGEFDRSTRAKIYDAIYKCIDFFVVEFPFHPDSRKSIRPLSRSVEGVTCDYGGEAFLSSDKMWIGRGLSVVINVNFIRLLSIQVFAQWLSIDRYRSSLMRVWGKEGRGPGAGSGWAIPRRLGSRIDDLRRQGRISIIPGPSACRS